MRTRTFSKLKNLMYARETTQDELAHRMDRSKTYLSRRLNAKEPFNTNDIKFLTKELEIPLNEWTDYFFEDDVI